MKKKIIVLILSAFMILSIFVGCDQPATVTTDDNVKDEVYDDKEQKQSNDETNEEDKNDTDDESKDEEKTNDETTDKDSEKDSNNSSDGVVKAYVTLSSLSIRNTPDYDNSKVLGAVAKGQEVIVLDEIKDPNHDILWYQIKLEDKQDNLDRYISAKYTTKNKEDLSNSSAYNYLNFDKSLDFEPVDKVKEYENNPRVEAKGVFLTRTSGQSTKKVDELIALANRTNINTFVIDIKDDDGKMLFESKTAEEIVPEANSHARDIEYAKELIKKLKENDIYVIGRVVSFKDPQYARTHPNTIIRYKSGEPFINSKVKWTTPYNRDLWKYIIGVSKEAAELGFNEIQFDYVRFPASNGGKLDKHLDYQNKLNESKALAIQNFLKEARKELSPMGVYISADVFGLVPSVRDDMGIGQHWEAISNYVDIISPMIYPSHYARGTYGVPIPDANPYKTVYECTLDSVERNENIKTPAVVRPWIQDFTATWVKGYINYGPKELEAQIKALEDAGVNEYLLWNAGNNYTEGGIR